MINKLICDDHWLISQLVKLIKLWSKKKSYQIQSTTLPSKKTKTTPNIIRKMRNLTIQKKFSQGSRNKEKYIRKAHFEVALMSYKKKQNY